MRVIRFVRWEKSEGSDLIQGDLLQMVCCDLTKVNSDLKRFRLQRSLQIRADGSLEPDQMM